MTPRIAALRDLPRRAAVSPITFSLLVAFVLSALLIVVTGADPFEAFADLFTGAVTGSGLGNTLARMIPIVGMALAVSVTFRSGIINLGGEGQMITGALVATMVALYVPAPGFVLVPLAIVAGAAAGALWALLSAVGQTRLGMPILISSLLLNYVARAVTGYLTRFHLMEEGGSAAASPRIPAEAQIPQLPVAGGLSVTFLMVVAAVAVLAVGYRRTVTGYDSEMIGRNQAFARYGGVTVPRYVLGLMALSGGIGGAIGGHLILGDALRFTDGELVGSGLAWTGLLVSLLAANRPLAILAAGAFFSILQVGGLAMQRSSGVSWQLAQVMQAIVIVVLTCRLTLHRRQGTSETAMESPTPTPAAAPAAPVTDVRPN